MREGVPLYTKLNFYFYYTCMHSTVVGVGFNQSEVFITEGTTAETAACAEITFGTLQRNITVFLETIALTMSGMCKLK